MVAIATAIAILGEMVATDGETGRGQDKRKKNYSMYVIQGDSLRGRPPSPATLVHNEELNETRLNEADREVHGLGAS